jgi:hypothetical protein
MKFLLARKTSRLTAALGWLLMYLLLVQGALPTLVLCFGSGGHIAVELPHSQVNHPLSQRQEPCLDVPLLFGKSEEQTLVVASGSALQFLVPVLVHAVAALQWLTAPPQADTSLCPDFSPLLPRAPVPPVILRI